MPEIDSTAETSQAGCCSSHDHEQKAVQVEHRHEERVAIVSMDALGIAASSICLVHCLAMPFVIGFLPLLGLQFLQGHFAHVVLAFFVLTFALFAIVPGFLKHRNNGVLLFMSSGLAMVLFATFGAGALFGESWEVPLITVGNLFLVGTHMRNRALIKCPTQYHS